MEKVILNIDGMSCEHCVKAITDAVSELSGVKSAAVDLKTKTATVNYNPDEITLEKIKEEIEELGYEIK